MFGEVPELVVWLLVSQSTRARVSSAALVKHFVVVTSNWYLDPQADILSPGVAALSALRW